MSKFWWWVKKIGATILWIIGLAGIPGDITSWSGALSYVGLLHVGLLLLGALLFAWDFEKVRKLRGAMPNWSWMVVAFTLAVLASFQAGMWWQKGSDGDGPPSAPAGLQAEPAVFLSRLVGQPRPEALDFEPVVELALNRDVKYVDFTFWIRSLWPMRVVLSQPITGNLRWADDLLTGGRVILEPFEPLDYLDRRRFRIRQALSNDEAMKIRSDLEGDGGGGFNLDELNFEFYFTIPGRDPQRVVLGRQHLPRGDRIEMVVVDNQ